MTVGARHEWIRSEGEKWRACKVSESEDKQGMECTWRATGWIIDDKKYVSGVQRLCKQWLIRLIWGWLVDRYTDGQKWCVPHAPYLPQNRCHRRTGCTWNLNQYAAHRNKHSSSLTLFKMLRSAPAFTNLVAKAMLSRPKSPGFTNLIDFMRAVSPVCNNGVVRQ